MKRNRKLLTPVLAGLVLFSCQPADTGVYIDGYVSSVSETAAIMVSGLYEGQTVDYVISSYPVVYKAMSRNSSLSVYENIATSFGSKYDTEGFPQAGLFIKKTLEEDTTKKNDILAFLNAFDNHVSDLINSNASSTITAMDAYSSDATTQEAYFGFSFETLKACQENGINRLSFISADKNPSLTTLAKFNEILGFSITEDSLSSFYPTVSSETTTDVMEDLTFQIACPSGAPAAALASFSQTSDNPGSYLNFYQASEMSARFAAAEDDFIIFDSYNGSKLASKYENNYVLARFVTFGNLYIISTGNDENKTFEKSDYTISFGEGLIPDFAFNAVYGD